MYAPFIQVFLYVAFIFTVPSSYSAFIIFYSLRQWKVIGKVQSLRQGTEGKIWMQIDKRTFIHVLILKEEELKISILLFSFEHFFGFFAILS